MPSTHKYKTLLLSEKSEILNRLNRSESEKKFAFEYGVGASTVSDIKKNHAKIKRCRMKIYNPSLGKRKTLKLAEYPEVEKLFYSWFCTQRAHHVPISYEILTAKTKQFYTHVYGNNTFTASRGWIRNIRSRHGLRVLKVCGKKLSNNQAVVKPFVTTLKTKMQSLNLSESHKCTMLTNRFYSGKCYPKTQ
ncbi:jerky protein homolog-like [Euwallacea similis]|uniref:jerky protein homolog-like n=1 Tax=Euwallacea similis TaxID=1736056 RepID=UPI00344FF40A